jgi:hypothetical protein
VDVGKLPNHLKLCVRYFGSILSSNSPQRRFSFFTAWISLQNIYKISCICSMRFYYVLGQKDSIKGKGKRNVKVVDIETEI